jgi:AraC-like DNA-binding protein
VTEAELAQIRAVSLTNYVEVARFLGLDPYAMLREQRISPNLLDNPENRLSARAAAELLERSAEASGCESFGLLMAECRTVASIGPLSLLLKHLPSPRAVIEDLIRYRRHMNDVVLLDLEDDGEMATFHCDLAPQVALRQATELATAFAYRVLTELSGGRWYPYVVHFRHSPPADAAAHRRFFQCPLDFDSLCNGLSCPSAWLDVGNPSADEAMADHARQLLEAAPFPSDEEGIADRVRNAIYLLIHGGRTTIEHVADNLALHPRALQRLLEKQGVTYADLLTETRRELAMRYLSAPHHSLGAIATLLGYSAQSSFNRWFSAEFGTTPASWRETAEAETRAARAA